MKWLEVAKGKGARLKLGGKNNRRCQASVMIADDQSLTTLPQQYENEGVRRSHGGKNDVMARDGIEA